MNIVKFTILAVALCCPMVASASCVDDLKDIRGADAQTAFKAAKVIANLGAKCGNTIEYSLELGSYYIKLKDYDYAARYFKAVIDGDNNAAHLGYLGLGKIHLHKMEFQRASEVFSKIVQDYPEWDKGYEHLGIAYVQSEKFKEAIQVLERGSEINRNNHQIFRYLGFAYFYISKPEEAISNFDNAFSLNQQLLLDKLMIIAASRSYIDIGKFEVAKSLLTILISNIPEIENDPQYILAVKYYNDKSGE